MKVWEDAEDEFERRFRQLGKSAFIYRFTDTKDARGALRSKKVFTDARPADFLLTVHGKMFYAEVKSCSSETSFAFANIRKSQWQAAIQQVAAGGLYYFFIRSEALNQWFMVPFEIIKNMESKKSLTWDELFAHKWG